MYFSQTSYRKTRFLPTCLSLMQKEYVFNSVNNIINTLMKTKINNSINTIVF